MKEMINNNEQIKRLYEDALYLHLIHNGYPEDKARYVVTNAMEQFTFSK